MSGEENVSAAEKEQMIKDCGREMGMMYLKNAILSAENKDQCLNHLKMVRHSAIHILATEIYNRIALSKEQPSFNDLMKEVEKEIRKEFLFMEENSENFKLHAVEFSKKG